MDIPIWNWEEAKDSLEESTINPGRWQIGSTVGSKTAGFDLVQWTAEKGQEISDYMSWSEKNGYNPYDIDTQLKRIQYEVDKGIQWQGFRTYVIKKI